MGSNPTGGKDVSFTSVVFCQIEVSATDRSLVQSSPNEYNVSEYDLQTQRSEDRGKLGLLIHETKYTDYRYKAVGLVTRWKCLIKFRFILLCNRQDCTISSRGGLRVILDMAVKE